MNILNTDTIIQILLKFNSNTPNAPKLLNETLDKNQNNVLDKYNNYINVPNTLQLNIDTNNIDNTYKNCIPQYKNLNYGNNNYDNNYNKYTELELYSTKNQYESQYNEYAPNTICKTHTTQPN